MSSNVRSRLRLLFIDAILASLLFSSATQAELFHTASSLAVQDGFINTAPTTCPVAQDGYTSNTFPWTHNPTCVNVVLPNDDGEGLGIHQTFCAYTNVNYNNGRGISFVVTPEVAASITSETFGMTVGGLEGQVGSEIGTWEVKETKEMGKGVFARRDVAAIFAGESLIINTPVLFISKQLLETPSTSRRQLVLHKAVEQLPDKTREVVKELAVSRDGGVKDIILTNGITVKWPWADEVPELLAITPEVARINHACRPNALWRFNDYTLAFDVFALKDIKAGEEITLSYGLETRSHRRRVKSIEANFGFTCGCPLCTADEAIIEESNDRLSEIKSLKSVLPTDEKDSPQLLALLPPLISTLEKEDLHNQLPMYEEILAYTWSSFGIEDRAKYWAGRARKHWAIIAGKESWEQKRCGDLEADVKSHATWMTWEGDPWEGVGEGHPWDDKEGEKHDHDH
ncbi:SET domain-containing protein [Cucurbitaria berberidis CBS 394.84]|uniref:SET domain-containing protein n=1 Tax=Cucurbitaria berberidis CBS 394.84 TaxID=1168544 RepID=A0A9P4L9G9_9PLEO|nr:SET domain-containing protein [Cucurbitaria berberidis CBS 394.84]KAF1847010.1 SET domain-containing protein [Cucurbitaria berberidis CBS 394.84]